MDHLIKSYHYSSMLLDKSLDYIQNINNKTKTNRVSPSRNTNFIKTLYNLTYTSTEIIERIYLGNAFNAKDFNQLKQNNIGMIVNVSEEIPNYYLEDFMYTRIPIRDYNESSILEYLDITITKIHKYLEDNPDKNVFIHCFMGSSRSASVVIAYLIKYNQMIYDDAYEFTKSKRPIVNLNVSFREQLIKFEKEN